MLEFLRQHKLFIISGSGKTFTMQPLPLRAAEDLVRLLNKPDYLEQKFKLWLSFFEIYGGKVFDLLGDRKYAPAFHSHFQHFLYCIHSLQHTYFFRWNHSGVCLVYLVLLFFRCMSLNLIWITCFDYFLPFFHFGISL